MYTFRLQGLTAQVLSVLPAPLEARSIFSSHVFLDHFEPLKSFIEDQTKLGLRILMPAKDTKYILTYSETSFEFNVYEIMLRRVIRRFKLRNPEYSREKEVELEMLLKEKQLKEERKRQKKMQRNSDSESDSQSSESHNEDSSDSSGESIDGDEEQKYSDSSDVERKSSKRKKGMK